MTSPISGVIASLEGTVGERVRAEQTLFTILNTERVFIEALVPEADLSRISYETGALYERPDDPDRYIPIMGKAGGRIAYIGQEVNPATRTVPIVYEIPNADGRLQVGMALHLYIETKTARDALTVPASAVVEESGLATVFVQASGEMFEKRNVRLGLRDAGFVQILDGVAEGEQVVSAGAYIVRLASVADSVPSHGHAH